MTKPHAPFPIRPSHASLRLIATTDLHGHVLAYDYLWDQPSDQVGLARAAALVAGARAEATASILVDNGDFLNGTVMSDLVARGELEGPHPVIAAMNELGYDAVNLGNHEFNYGLEALITALEQADFPILSSNVYSTSLSGLWPQRNGGPLVQRSVILDRQLVTGEGLSFPIRIGLLGLLPPQITRWDRRHLLGRVGTTGILETARAEAAALKRRGADIVIALSHSGIEDRPYRPGDENASAAVAGLPDVDAVVAGHTHRRFPGPGFETVPGIEPETGTIHGTPVVEAGFWGSHVAVIDLELRHTQFGWIKVRGRGAARPIAERSSGHALHALVQSNPKVEAAVEDTHRHTLRRMRAPVGETAVPLHSYFTMLGMDAALKVVTDAQAWLVRSLLEGQPGGDLPLLSASAPGKSGGRGGPDFYTEVRAGPISHRSLSDLYLFPNTMTVLDVSGRMLLDWLEHCAGAFRQVAPGAQDVKLRNEGFPTFNFDIVDGLRYTIDLSQPARFGPAGELLHPEATRVVEVTYQGKPVEEDDRFALATNNYRATGGGGFPGIETAPVLVETLMTNREALAGYIAQAGVLKPRPDPVFRFAPLDGATVLFDSGPSARSYLGDLTLPAEDVGETDGGFARFRLTL
ncbi:bifunctional 2',3'-cyclic-nucleotide 2'-phosphodiesterase/3'-nucleotidase [Aestuariibius sp. 2305UL40-4]|uniref:bifunctional 2',3'-cyclic-nucleotide 2'-phosphodiesterase/3'-nucleotidase n=1 Tax=Aestuariibius violaceus TaxID=3234132 RepID=UPI00345EFD3C